MFETSAAHLDYGAHRRCFVVVEDGLRPEGERLARELRRQREGMQVTVAAGFDEARAMLSADRDYDMALVELDLPRMDSFRLVRQLRRDLPAAAPVIMFSDYGDEKLWVDAVNQGASDLYSTPDLMAGLQRRIA